MASNLPLFEFDDQRGEAKKEQGIDAAASARAALLEQARRVAVSYATQYGTVTMDNVFDGMLVRGIDPTELGNAAGSVFRRQFIFTGQWRKSCRVSNHARMNRVWALQSRQDEGRTNQ